MHRLVPNLNHISWIEKIPEDTNVLLVGSAFEGETMVYAPIGYLQNSEALSRKIASYVEGRQWATLTRNDGHYIEITVEGPDNKGTTPNDPNPNQST